MMKNIHEEEKWTTGNRKKGDNKNEALSSKSFFAILTDSCVQAISTPYIKMANL